MSNLSLKIIDIRKPENKVNLIVSYNNGKAFSYFNDDIWNYKNNSSYNKIEDNTIIDFTKLANKKLNNKELLKEIAYILFNFEKKTAKTVKINLNSLSTFFNFVQDEYNIVNIKDISVIHSNSFINFIIKKEYSFTTSKNYLSPLRSILYKHYAELSWGFQADPYSDITINKILKNSKQVKETNQTQVIPQKNWKSIICLCSDYISQYESFANYENLIHEEYKKHSNGDGYSIKYFNKKYFHFKKWGFPYNGRKEHSLFLENVSVSAAILIQAFTGMRESELLSLQEDCIVDTRKDKLNKIKGYTFKYETSDLINNSKGREVDWLCPDIVVRAINALKNINSNANYQFKKYNEINQKSTSRISFTEGQKILFINNYSGEMLSPKLRRVTSCYNNFINDHKIYLDFQLTSHCFRRTLARFFAKSLLNMPVDILKEQFKHFSKDITYYYMKEDNDADGEFINLIEDYKKQENKDGYFKEIKNKLMHSIENANNVNELTLFLGNDKLSIVNEYMSIIEYKGVVSPLECLTCEGVILLPDLHLSYWEDMLKLYEELLEHEPNSKWFKMEKEQINNVVKKLQKNEAYIVRSKKQ
jgi:integrase